MFEIYDLRYDYKSIVIVFEFLNDRLYLQVIKIIFKYNKIIDCFNIDRIEGINIILDSLCLKLFIMIKIYKIIFKFEYVFFINYLIFGDIVYNVMGIVYDFEYGGFDVIFMFFVLFILKQFIVLLYLGIIFVICRYDLSFENSRVIIMFLQSRRRLWILNILIY